MGPGLTYRHHSGNGDSLCLPTRLLADCNTVVQCGPEFPQAQVVEPNEDSLGQPGAQMAIGFESDEQPVETSC